MSVFRWIPTIAHVWPGITPLNVWEMRYDMWLLFVRNARVWEEERTKKK
ncbi:hypothetical protein [Arthrobacter sp. B1805]|nr:hypothetical protein [Arthrobacter sp. B1805]